MIKKTLYSSLVLCLLLLASSCNTRKYLNAGEAFLVKNAVEVNGKVKDKLAFKDEIETLFKQKPTPKRKRWFYYKTKGRFQRRFGEKPTIWSSELTEKTAQSMQFFLQNKGYHKAKVTYEKHIRKQKAKVTYRLNINELFTIDSIRFTSKDPEINKIINAVRADSYLKKGAPLDVNIYRQEVNRLTSTIRNFGYANFNTNYFAQLDADTTKSKANVILEVLTPNDADVHTKYTIGKVKVQANYKADLKLTNEKEKDTLVNGIIFTAPNGVFPINITTLLNCIKVLPKSDFRQDNLNFTYSKFENLNAFRLINIKTEFNPQQRQEVDVLITLVPYGKRSISSNFELNTTQGVAVLGGNVGISASVNTKNNNVFGNAERSSTNIEFGVQGLFSPSNNFYETTLQQDLAVPKFYDPVHFWKYLNKVVLFKTGSGLKRKPVKLFSDADFKNMQERASSRISGGFKYIKSQPIDYFQINANVGYLIPLQSNKSLSINQLSIEYLLPVKLEPPISDNEFLKRLFSRQFVTSIFLKDISYAYQNSVNTNVFWSKKIRMKIEQSGLELFAINKLVDAAQKRNQAFQFGNTDYSRFLRSEIDAAFGKNVGYNKSLHFHANVAAAIPYGYKNTIVPYVKQYYVGGPMSMRGWQPRELGPGGWINPSATSTYYSTGDVKIETNAEFRFGLWWLFKSAIFVDVGNVWSLYANEDYKNADFTKDFYKQLAITAGTGLRFDFSYSVIRIDAGYRLRYPYPDVEGGTHWNTKNAQFGRNWNFTFGLGYPF